MLTIHSVKYQIMLWNVDVSLSLVKQMQRFGDISFPSGLVNDDHLSSSTHRESDGALNEAH